MKYRLIRHQLPMLNIISQVALFSLLPKKMPKTEIPNQVMSTSLIPNKDIVDSFHEWLDQNGRYTDCIAPHLFPQWCMPLLFPLYKKLNLPLHKIVNQGCSMEIFAKIKTDEQLIINGQITSITEEENKFTIIQIVNIYNTQKQILLRSEIQSAILKSASSKKLSKKKEYPLSILFDRQNTIVIKKNDATEYALISGDFNPIHLSKLPAKLMGFKSNILHGFALLSKIYETLLDNEIKIKKIQLKFLKPVYLDSLTHLDYRFDSKNSHVDFALKSSDAKVIHIMGSALTES